MKFSTIILHLLLTALLLTLLSKQTKGQIKSPLFSISGKVIDSVTRQPLNYVTISLNKTDQQTLMSVLTKADGNFILESLASGEYLITASSIGYAPQIIPINVKDGINDSTVHLEEIQLAIQSNQLNEVSIIANRPLIKQGIDRITYDLQADPESKVNSLLDMMRKVPFVSLDAENNILLKGSTDYKILINGKASSMMERDPKAILRSMPASTIQNIEVITNPPAKYDAEGYAGIINIITNKKVSNGYKGSINVNEKLPVGGPGFGGALASKQGKFGISTFFGGNTYNTPSTFNSKQRTTFGDSFTNLVQSGDTRSRSSSGYFSTDLSYELDSLNLISAQFNLNGNNSKDYNNQFTSLSNKEESLQSYGLNNQVIGTGNGLDAAINYQLGFKKNKASLLTVSYRLYNYDNDQDIDLKIQHSINFLMPDYRQINKGNFAENTFQMDYITAGKKVVIELGAKAIFRDNKSDFSNSSLNSVNGQYESDSGLSDHFNNDQNVLGAYNSYSFSIKSWDFKAGARVERTTFKANFVSGDSVVQHNYFNLIPTIAINKRLNEFNNLNFGFVQRIRRPGINKLNPFVDRSKPNFETSGNPDLNTSVINNVQIGYNRSKKASFTIGVAYSFFKDLDLRVSTFDPVTDVTHTTYQNIANGGLLSTDLNINYPITKAWSYSLNGNLTYINMEGKTKGLVIKQERVSYSFTTSSGYSFNKGYRINASLNVIGKSPSSLQSVTSAVINSSFSATKEIFKDKLSFSASVNNPIKKYRNNTISTYSTDFQEINNSRLYFRSFTVGLNYNFGKLKDSIRKNKRGIKNDDVSNSSF